MNYRFTKRLTFGTSDDRRASRPVARIIEETGTELERVLAYYKLAALEEMSEGSYRRALDLLQRRRSKLELPRSSGGC